MLDCQVFPPLPDLAAGCTEPSLWATVVKVTLLVEVISSLELYSTASIILPCVAMGLTNTFTVYVHAC